LLLLSTVCMLVGEHGVHLLEEMLNPYGQS